MLYAYWMQYFVTVLPCTDQCVGLQHRRAAHATTTSSTAVRPWGHTSTRAAGGGAGHGGNSIDLLLRDRAGNIVKIERNSGETVSKNLAGKDELCLINLLDGTFLFDMY